MAFSEVGFVADFGASKGPPSKLSFDRDLPLSGPSCERLIGEDFLSEGLDICRDSRSVAI